MKRPPGAIPPLTEAGVQTLIGKKLRVRVWMGSPNNCWWLKLKRVMWLRADDVVFEVEHRFKNRTRVALSECVFDEEDPLVASVRRQRFLAKLNASAESRKADKSPSAPSAAPA